MVLAATSLSNGSSTWSTVDVLVSGGADAMATTTDSRLKMTVKPIASNRQAFVRN